MYSSWQTLDSFHGVDKSLANKIQTAIPNVKTIDELIQTIKTKNYTYQRLSRTLSLYFMRIQKEMAIQFQTPTYIRILGFTKKGKQYLHEIKDSTLLPPRIQIQRKRKVRCLHLNPK